MPKVAVVTGSNKGIGLAIVRGLCKQINGDVVLTARDEELGKQTVNNLNKEGLYPKFHQLDITSLASINRLCKYLQDNYEGLDILVNNAAVCSVYIEGVPKYPEDVDITMNTNYHGTLKVCKILFPILNKNARVVNISSRGATHALNRCAESRIRKIMNASRIDELTEMINEFVHFSKNGNFVSAGWPEYAVQNSYGVSKIGVMAITPLQQSAFDLNAPELDTVVNSCCPGYVETDMSAHRGILSPEEGADTPLFLALLPPDVTEPRGEFVFKRKAYDWKHGDHPNFSDVTGVLDSMN